MTMLSDHVVDGLPLLEALRATEASLEDRPWEFGDWTQCTCGHIYFGATGGDAETPRELRDLSNTERGGELPEVCEAFAYALSVGLLIGYQLGQSDALEAQVAP